jgi:argonaute-like protein implicated in RNA metabolism and viral defense
LGSASIGEGRLGKRERIVGITTVFTGDGNYHLSNLSQAVPMADYGEALLDSLRVTISKVQQELNWQKRDHVRLVFHSFKPFKDVEADAVKEAVAELSDYDVDLAFIHIADNHPYGLFDESQGGVFDPRVRKVKGVYAPERGYFLRLSKYEVLMTTTGAKDIKHPEHGMPRPILLKLHRNSTFNDTTYLARQVFAFTCHSWRSFFPSQMPVTILYSDLIADLLGNLATVSFWNPDSMLGRIGKTRWFL